MDGYFFDSLTVAVYQPELDGADVTAVNTAGDARGIAIQTGYTCANDGCHMNGSFNGLSENAYLGDYKLDAPGPDHLALRLRSGHRQDQGQAT